MASTVKSGVACLRKGNRRRRSIRNDKTLGQIKERNFVPFNNGVNDKARSANGIHPKTCSLREPTINKEAFSKSKALKLPMTAFLMVFRRFPTTLRRFPKLFRKPDERSRTFSENFRRLLKTFEEDRKMFRWYTNEFKYNWLFRNSAGNWDEFQILANR